VWKKLKSPLTLVLFFFSFKSIFIVSLYILIIYCFLYLINTKLPLNWHYKYEKNHYESTKISFDTSYNFFLLPMIFWLFHYVIKIRENLSLLRGAYTEKNFQFMIFWSAITWRIFLKEVEKRECIGVSLVIFKYKKKTERASTIGISHVLVPKKKKTNTKL
jgi:hypothetical protein